MTPKKMMALMVGMLVMSALTLFALLRYRALNVPLPRVYGAAPRIQLTDATGSPFDSASLTGKLWVVDFFFSRCGGPCPTMGLNMKRVRGALDPAKVHLLSITVDPEHDQANILATYARKWDADPANWSFLTGPAAEIRKVSFEGFKLGSEQLIDHSTRFVLVDKQGLIRGYFEGTDPAGVEELIETAQRLY